MNILSFTFSLLYDKKALKKFGLRTCFRKKPFGYRVVHHGCLLTSYQSFNRLIERKIKF